MTINFILFFSILSSITSFIVFYYVYKLFYILISQYNDLPNVEYIDNYYEEEIITDAQKSNLYIPPQEYIERFINSEEDNGVEIITLEDELEQQRRYGR